MCVAPTLAFCHSETGGVVKGWPVRCGWLIVLCHLLVVGGWLLVGEGRGEKNGEDSGGSKEKEAAEVTASFFGG
jgi:hypothetical protein